MDIVNVKEELLKLDSKRLNNILTKVASNLQVALGREIGRLEQHKGKVLNNSYNINYALDMGGRLKVMLEEAGLDELLRQYTNTTMKVYELLKGKVIRDSGLPLLLDRTDNEYFTTILKKDLSKIRGLSINTLDRIKDTFIESSLYELSDRQLIRGIADVVNTNMIQYSKTYMNTSRGMFIQGTIDRNYNKIKEEGHSEDYLFEYVGAYDNNLREPCRIGLSKRYFTEEEKLEFEAYYGVRYNCRHSFVLVTTTEAISNKYDEVYKNRRIR